MKMTFVYWVALVLVSNLHIHFVVFYPTGCAFTAAFAKDFQGQFSAFNLDLKCVQQFHAAAETPGASDDIYSNT